MRLARAAHFVLACTVLIAGQKQESEVHAPWVSCFDSMGEHFIGSKREQTPTLRSPDGVHRAYAVIRAVGDPKVESCKNTGQLFISTRNSPFKLVFTQAPSDDEGTVDDLEPIAWSPNSRWLAVELGFSNYGSDAGGLALLLYDARSRRVTTPNVIGAIERSFRKRCVLGYRSTIGFDTQNRVVVRVSDWWEDFDHRESYCIQDEEDWLFDPASGAVRRRAAP